MEFHNFDYYTVMEFNQYTVMEFYQIETALCGTDDGGFFLQPKSNKKSPDNCLDFIQGQEKVLFHRRQWVTEKVAL